MKSGNIERLRLQAKEDGKHGYVQVRLIRSAPTTVSRLYEIQRAAEAGDVMEVVNLCELLREDMLTPTAKDRS